MKTIRTAILITIVLFTLSSCDAVLEIFYPEFASKGDGYAVSIRAEFNMYPDEVYGTGQYFAAQIIDLYTREVVRQVAAEPYFNWIEEKTAIYWRIEGNIDFYDVPDGEYEVLVWLEQDGDGEPYGPDELYMYATRYDSFQPNVFSLPEDADEYGWAYGEALLTL